MSFEPKQGVVVAGRYALDKRIGEGGMGNVWKARDRVLDCPIALKLVTHRKGEVDQPALVARFVREARMSAAVQHPSVVRVTDFGVHEDTPYIAMELLEGKSLADRMYELPLLSPKESARICVAVLRGLAAAHDAGVIHRDIKPDNIHLVSGPGGTYPKLIDFGISLGTVAQRRVSVVTTDGHIFGTPVTRARPRVGGRWSRGPLQHGRGALPAARRSAALP